MDMDTGIWLGIVGLAATLGLGLGALIQGRRSARAATRHAKSVSSTLTEIHAAVVGPEPHIAEDSEARRLKLAAVAYAEIFNDGETLLLVQHWTGAHATLLRVFGWRDFDFRELAQVGTGTPEGFTVGDLDGDGRVEVATVEADWERTDATGHTYSYAAGARRELLYRWNGEKFEMVGARRLPLPNEGPRNLLWHTNPIEIPYNE